MLSGGNLENSVSLGFASTYGNPKPKTRQKAGFWFVIVIIFYECVLYFYAHGQDFFSVYCGTI